MTIRMFAIEGRALGDQQLVTCAALACRAVGPTIATAAQRVQQQVTTLWTQQTADLPVLVEVSPMTLPLPSAQATPWHASLMVATNETPMQGIVLEQRLGVPWDEQVVGHLTAHQQHATSLAAYQELLTAIEWYLSRPHFPAALRPDLRMVRSRVQEGIRLLENEATHFRDYTLPYRVKDADDLAQPWS